MTTPFQPTPEDLEWKNSLSTLSQAARDEQLCEAVSSQSLWHVEQALAAGADVHTCGDQPIRKAAVFGLYQIAKTLLEAGADLHVNDEEPLCWAARAGNVALVEFFLSRGADPKSWGGSRAQQWAASYGKEAVVAILDQAIALRDKTPTDTGAAEDTGVAESIAELVESGASLPIEEISKGGAKSDTYLYILGDAKKLDRLFEPKLWVGKVDEMIRLYERIPTQYKEQISLPEKIAAVRLHILKSSRPPGFKFK